MNKAVTGQAEPRRCTAEKNPTSPLCNSVCSVHINPKCAALRQTLFTLVCTWWALCSWPTHSASLAIGGEVGSLAKRTLVCPEHLPLYKSVFFSACRQMRRHRHYEKKLFAASIFQDGSFSPLVPPSCNSAAVALHLLHLFLCLRISLFISRPLPL